MGKPYLTLTTKDSASLLNRNAQEWTLCLGAGINKGILPDWSDLTLNLVNQVFKFSWTKVDFEAKSKSVGFSYDGWIQACLNKHISNGQTVDEFLKILEDEIYGKLLAKASIDGIENLIRRFLNKPQMKNAENKKIRFFFEKHFSDTTLMHLVDVLTSDPKKYKLPGSIITLNADTLLYSLLTLYNQEKFATRKRPRETELYKNILRSYHSWGQKIPIFHIHGSIFPELPTHTKASKANDGRENLIFLETSYTKVAGSMFTWAQTNFLYYALNTKIIFFGLSMSDPNIRKWLNWTSENVNAGLKSYLNDEISANKHIWLKPKPTDPKVQDFLQNSLQHLGVKMGWVDNYDQVRQALLNIMIK